MAILLPALHKTNQILSGLPGVQCEAVVATAPSPVVDSLFASMPDVRLPSSLRQIYAEEAGSIEFSWLASPYVFGQDCRRGNVSFLSPARSMQMLRDQRAQASETTAEGYAENDEGYSAVAADWPHWLPVFRFPSGDCFCLDLRDPAPEPGVVFLEHDVMDAGPNLHGLRMAEGLEELIERWRQIHFVELFDWNAAVGESGIDPDSPVVRAISAASG